MKTQSPKALWIYSWDELATDRSSMASILKKTLNENTVQEVYNIPKIRCKPIEAFEVGMDSCLKYARIITRYASMSVKKNR